MEKSRTIEEKSRTIEEKSRTIKEKDRTIKEKNRTRTTIMMRPSASFEWCNSNYATRRMRTMEKRSNGSGVIYKALRVRIKNKIISCKLA